MQYIMSTLMVSHGVYSLFLWPPTQWKILRFPFPPMDIYVHIFPLLSSFMTLKIYSILLFRVLLFKGMVFWACWGMTIPCIMDSHGWQPRLKPELADRKILKEFRPTRFKPSWGKKSPGWNHNWTEERPWLG